MNYSFWIDVPTPEEYQMVPPTPKPEDPYFSEIPVPPNHEISDEEPMEAADETT